MCIYVGLCTWRYWLEIVKNNGLSALLLSVWVHWLNGAWLVLRLFICLGACRHLAAIYPLSWQSSFGNRKTGRRLFLRQLYEPETEVLLNCAVYVSDFVFMSRCLCLFLLLSCSFNCLSPSVGLAVQVPIFLFASIRDCQFRERQRQRQRHR